MTGFMIAAAVAVLLTLVLLLRPFFRRSAAAPASQRQLNAAIYREQLARLDQDQADGTLGADDYAQARAELQRRVLQDTAHEDDAPTLHAPRRTLIALAVTLPLSAFGLYFALGSPASMNPVAAQAAPSSADVERMVSQLAAKLEKDPGNLKGWAMLARSYKVMGRSLEAERAYERAGAFIETDAQLLADYADVAAANANGSFAGKPVKLIEKALQIDPQNPMALWLAGTAELAAGKPDRAVAIWTGLIKLLPPGGEDVRMLQAAIDEVRAAGAGAAPSAAPARAQAPAATAVAAGGSVSGTVELAPALRSKVGKDDTVMVIARLPGSRMPVAVFRVRGGQLPLAFTLDDRLAMSPQALISAAGEVEVEARISSSGMAKAEPGDLISEAQTVKVGASGVTLNVAQVRP